MIDYGNVQFWPPPVGMAQPVDPPKPATPNAGGVGTELLNHGLMRLVKWALGSKCDCRKKAAEWDASGIEWCEQHVDDELIPHLRATAGRFGLPWSEEIARRLIRVAVLRAKRKARGFVR